MSEKAIQGQKKKLNRKKDGRKEGRKERKKAA
jgi:hypothetical protein